MPEQLLPGAAIVCLGIAQVWEFDEPKGAVPRLARGIGQLVHARQGPFASLMQGVHGAGDERGGEATAVPRGMNEEQVEPGPVLPVARQQGGSREGGVRSLGGHRDAGSRQQGSPVAGKTLAQITAGSVVQLLIRVIAERLVVCKGCQIDGEQWGCIVGTRRTDDTRGSDWA